MLKLDNVDLLSFIGINDRNIKPLEERFNTNITVRGDVVYFQGIQEEVDAETR